MHAAAPDSEYLASAPHEAHVPDVSATNFPAVHGVAVLLPSQECPAKQAPQAVCVLSPPPDVLLGAAHDEQPVAAAADHLRSFPQFEHRPVPAAAEVPASHFDCTLVPLHE